MVQESLGKDSCGVFGEEIFLSRPTGEVGADTFIGRGEAKESFLEEEELLRAGLRWTGMAALQADGR